MTPPPLCIIQARYHSTRLPGKMLLTLGEETLIARAWRIATEAFTALLGGVNVVVAIPHSDEVGPLGDELRRIGATVFAWDGAEADVLGRFYHCAHQYRWHPDTVIVRYTPDDPFKTATALRATAWGYRQPVEIGGEAFTLAMLDEAHRIYRMCFSDDRATGRRREHISEAIFPTPPPPCPPGAGWTIDTQADYEAAKQRLVNGER